MNHNYVYDMSRSESLLFNYIALCTFVMRFSSSSFSELKFRLADFVYLMQELRSDCIHLSNKYEKIVMPSVRFLNQITKDREAEV